MVDEKGIEVVDPAVETNVVPAKKEHPLKHGNPNWKKGVSANPSGRPKTPPEVKSMLKMASVEAFYMLMDIVRGKDPKAKTSDKIKAGEIIIERTYGKTPQPIVSDEDGAAIVVQLVGSLSEWGK